MRDGIAHRNENSISFCEYERPLAHFFLENQIESYIIIEKCTETQEKGMTNWNQSGNRLILSAHITYKHVGKEITKNLYFVSTKVSNFTP